MGAAAILAMLLSIGPGSDQRASAEVAPPVVSTGPETSSEPEPPIEGPARPSESGIEFAVDPPEDPSEGEAAGEEEDPAKSAPPFEDPDSWPQPGTAPSDGFGLISSGAILVPSATLLSLYLLTLVNDRQDRIGIIATGSIMGAMAGAFIGTGLYRHSKLRRWTLAYRVVAVPQGAGMLTAGGIALNFGVALIGTGITMLAKQQSLTGGIALGAGLAAGLVATPPLLVFGKRRRQYYLRTGGWYRPALPPVPTVQLTPQPIFGHDSFGFGLGVAGRF